MTTGTCADPSSGGMIFRNPERFGQADYDDLLSLEFDCLAVPEREDIAALYPDHLPDLLHGKDIDLACRT